MTDAQKMLVSRMLLQFNSSSEGQSLQWQAEVMQAVHAAINAKLVSIQTLQQFKAVNDREVAEADRSEARYKAYLKKEADAKRKEEERLAAEHKKLAAIKAAEDAKLLEETEKVQEVSEENVDP